MGKSKRQQGEGTCGVAAPSRGERWLSGCARSAAGPSGAPRACSGVAAREGEAGETPPAEPNEGRPPSCCYPLLIFTFVDLFSSSSSRAEASKVARGTGRRPGGTVVPDPASGPNPPPDLSRGLGDSLVAQKAKGLPTMWET